MGLAILTRASGASAELGTITITSGPDAGKAFPLAESQVIGRLGRCTITIRDTRASREHARVFRNRGTFFVTDLNSKNGISVNGQSLRKAQLQPGDELQVGETFFRIDFEPAPQEAPASAPAPVSAARGPTSSGIEVVGSSGVSTDVIRTGAHRTRRGQDHLTRTSLSWLRTDLSQVSNLYRVMLLLGFILLAGGLGYLAFMMVR